MYTFIKGNEFYKLYGIKNFKLIDIDDKFKYGTTKINFNKLNNINKSYKFVLNNNTLWPKYSNNKQKTYIFDLTIFNDSIIGIKNNEIIIDKFELTNKLRIYDQYLYDNINKNSDSYIDLLKIMIKKTPYIFKDLDEKYKTYEICLLSVRSDGNNLNHIPNKHKTNELCLTAVKQCGYALNYVNKQTPELCLAAVKQDGFSLKYVKNQTEEICFAAIKHSLCAIKYVRTKTIELCLEVVKKDGNLLFRIENQTNEICLAAVKQNGCALEYVENQTNEICLAAVKQNGCALEYVENQTEEICLAAVKKNECVLNQTNGNISVFNVILQHFNNEL